MKFVLIIRNKFTAETNFKVVEADTEADARYENEIDNYQILSVRPLRLVGEKSKKSSKPVYTRTQTLRNRVERDLSDKQMKLGKYSPEAVVAAKVKEELKRVQENLQNAQDLTDALNQE
jgi:hypothetical protein